MITGLIIAGTVLATLLALVAAGRLDIERLPWG